MEFSLADEDLLIEIINDQKAVNTKLNISRKI
jgi:hypothetical protein